MSKSHILRVGHRGCAGHAPENTLAALEAGIALGVDYLEIDVQCSRDGKFVLMHDKWVDRTTDGSGKVAELSWAELATLDAGGGQRIPLLQDALDLANGRTGLILEVITPGIGIELHRMVKEFHFQGPVIYSSFLHNDILAIHESDPEANTMALLEGVPVSMAAFAIDAGATHAGIALESMTRRFGKALQSAGIKIFLYTVDTVEQIDLAKELAPYGVISNFPERL